VVKYKRSHGFVITTYLTFSSLIDHHFAFGLISSFVHIARVACVCFVALFTVINIASATTTGNSSSLFHLHTYM